MSNPSQTDYFETARGVRMLWIGMLAAPVLWFANQQLMFLLSYWARGGGSVWVLHGVTLACFVGAVFAGRIAFGHLRQLHAQKERANGSIHARATFMAIVGVLTSSLFALVILAHAIPVLLLDPCR